MIEVTSEFLLSWDRGAWSARGSLGVLFLSADSPWLVWRVDRSRSSSNSPQTITGCQNAPLRLIFGFLVDRIQMGYEA
jgi:hypothetical protein